MSSMNKGYIAVIVVVVIVVAGLGAFLFFTNTSSGNEIVIGASVSLTGSLNVEGTGVSNGMTLAVKNINNAGGVLINGTYYKIKLITINDESSKNQAATNYNTLIQSDHAQFLIGPYGSSNVLSVAPVVEQAKIPMVQAGGSSDSIYTAGYQYTFGLYRLASTYSEPIFTYLNATTHIKDIHKVAVFVQNEAFSLSVSNGTQTFLTADHFVVGTNATYYLHATNDLQTVDTQMKALANAGGADMILAIGHYADAKEVVQDVSSNNLKPKVVFGTVGVDEPTFVTDLGTAGNNTLGFSQWVPSIPESSAPGITNFVSQYNTTYGSMPSYHGAGGYAAVQTLVHAIESSNSLNPQKVRAALAATDFDCIWGHVQFTSTGYITGAGFMIQVQNNKIQTVAPDTYATSTVTYPFKS